ncbi:MAG: DMT family transporter [Chloroflexi bacterium]|nr:DMT family transporter [Chloroflexota bacterium]
MVPREYLVLFVATLVWGSVHPTVKFALTELTPVQLALLRPLFACVVLSLLVLVTGRANRIQRQLCATPGTLLTLGVLGFAASGGLTSIALSLLPAGVTSLMTNSSPLMVVVAGLLIFHQRIGWMETAGAVVGFLGVALLSLSDLQMTGDPGPTLLGSMLALGSAACWAAYTGIARRLARADPLVTTAITSAIGTLAIAVVAVPTQDWSLVTHASTPVIAATVWAGAMATGCTYAAWSYALRRLPAVAVAPFGYLIPVSALTISHFWLGESLTPAVLAGAACVLAGVGLTQFGQIRLLLRAESPSRA